MACNSVTNAHTLLVITLADFVSERQLYAYSAEADRHGHKFKYDREVETVDTVVGNKGHGL
jgi:hypothetical protein